MGKSVYSMVLSDEVITLIDEAALKNGKSRSNLINEILADYVGYNTADKRVDEILNLILAAYPMRRMRVEHNRKTRIEFFGAMNYKYKPRVTYSAELFTEDSRSGLLKIELRTTNLTLIGVMENFLNGFIAIEKKYIPGIEYFTDDGKLVRRLNFKNMRTEEEIAMSLATYVHNIDELIDAYTLDYFNGALCDANLEINYLKIKDSVNF